MQKIYDEEYGRIVKEICPIVKRQCNPESDDRKIEVVQPYNLSGLT